MRSGYQSPVLTEKVDYPWKLLKRIAAGSVSEAELAAIIDAHLRGEYGGRYGHDQLATAAFSVPVIPTVAAAPQQFRHCDTAQIAERVTAEVMKEVDGIIARAMAEAGSDVRRTVRAAVDERVRQILRDSLQNGV